MDTGRPCWLEVLEVMEVLTKLSKGQCGNPFIPFLANDCQGPGCPWVDSLSRGRIQAQKHEVCIRPASSGRAVLAFPPTAYLIGAQKAGTTYLAALLDQHPEIQVSQPKEPHFFTQQWERGIEWYRSCFPEADSARILLDASPSYAAAPVHRDAELARGRTPGRMAAVPQRIAQLVPEARFIYVLRDPVERVHSAYWHAVRIGEEDRPFRKAIQTEPKYLNMSDYLGQLHHYLRTFPLERFLFLRFEDLCSDPRGQVQQVATFLGVEGSLEVFTETGRHTGYRPGGLLRAILAARKQVPGMDYLQEAVWKLMPAWARERMQRHLTQPLPELDPDDRELLAAHFGHMVGSLQEVTGLDLSVWRSVSADRPITRRNGFVAPEEGR